jgi:A/G-specific adenine glycosylase
MVAGWREIGEIRHGFTHFELRISVFSASVPVIAADGFLQNATQLEGEALPSVMRKCVALARKAG